MVCFLLFGVVVCFVFGFFFIVRLSIFLLCFFLGVWCIGVFIRGWFGSLDFIWDFVLDL